MGPPATRFCVPPEAAWPVSATWSTSAHVLTVNFGHLLVDGTSVPGNFTYWDGVNEWVGVGVATVNMRTVTASFNIGPPDATPASCSYDAIPADVIDRNTLPVVAFAGFPVTVVP